MWIKILFLTFMLSVINGQNEEKIDDDMEVFASKIKAKYKEVNIDENDLRKKAIRSELISANEVKPPSNDYISVGIIVCNVSTSRLVKGIMRMFSKMLQSMFVFSTGSPIHLVLITDAKSHQYVHSAVANSISKFLSETLIQTKTDILIPDWEILSIFPNLWVEFVDVKSITTKHRDAIKSMREYFSQNTTEIVPFALDDAEDGTPRVGHVSPKYNDDLFYIAPFYGSELVHVNRFIMLDADLEIRQDLGDLYKYFNLMNSTEIIGITTDQSGYYHLAVKYIFQKMKDDGVMYIRTDDHMKIRGLNTGVVLYNTEKMRNSEEFNGFLKEEKIIRLPAEIGLYHGWFQVGDQDFLNTIMWRAPHLFKVLPCEWNFQDPKLRLVEEFKCEKRPKILHIHGEIHDEYSKI